jgi:two-component system NtrC family sensor kinase
MSEVEIPNNEIVGRLLFVKSIIIIKFDSLNAVRYINYMQKKSLNSLTGKLIIAIGSMMLLVGLFVAYVFKSQHPEIRLGLILAYGGFFVITISFILCSILYSIVTKPISVLVDGMSKLSKGDMDYRLHINSKDEIGILAHSFNEMAEELKQYRDKMENWTKSLEDEVEKKTAEIVKAQEQLVNAEKLASLGRMSAGVAHELNSPLTGIVTFGHLMLKRLTPDRTQDIEDTKVIIEQAERCSKIVRGLLGFSRKTASEKSVVNLNKLVENTIDMVKNQAKFHDIVFKLNLDGSLPAILIDSNQIQQVFLNLLINAADAMEENGAIIISSETINDSGRTYAELKFCDTGTGIPSDIAGKIFEPFFTTKPVGKGTGLGLSVSYGIIKKHEGSISVANEPGSGACFVVRLPVNAE